MAAPRMEIEVTEAAEGVVHRCGGVFTQCRKYRKYRVSTAKAKKKKRTKHGRYIKMIYGGKEHLIGSLQLILIFNLPPISSNFEQKQGPSEL